MDKMAKRKISLIFSLITIMLCMALFMGTAYAWFTDSSENKNNVIKTGTLNVEMYFTSAEQNPETAVWTKAGDEAMFSSNKWEPGYAEAKHVRIANEGNLAFKYKLVIIPNGEYADLAELIDVYYFADALQITDRSMLTDEFKVGTLKELILDVDGAAYGVLLPEGATARDGFNESVGSVTGTIAFKLSEDAGDEFQNKSIGESFKIKAIATQYSYESNGFNDDYDLDVKFPQESISLGTFRLLDDVNTSITVVDGEIIFSSNGVAQIKLPKENVEITDNVVTITGTNGLDGVYTIHEDGYVDKDGEIIAKSETTWLDVETGTYFVVHDGLVYLSVDGNTIYKEDGQTKAEPILNLNELSKSVDEYISSLGVSIDEYYDTYGYRFNEYNEGEFAVGNLFDVIAVQNIVEKGEHYWGIYTGRYDYWGGAAKDVKTDDALLYQVNWSETDLDAVVTTKVYIVTEDGEKLLSVNDVVDGGTIKVVQETTYYHDGVETDNVMFFEDYALYFEDGMTYGEWMREYFIMELHDICNGMHDHNGIYIAEEYLDDLCETGYNNKIQTPPERIYNDYFGYYASNGKAWYMEMIFYSYGKTYIRPTNFNETGYEYLGMSWVGGLQTDGTIYADDYYNYFIRNGLEPKAVPFYSAFKPENDTYEDISNYLSINSSNEVVVDVSALKTDLGLEDNINVIPAYEKDGYFVDCRYINCTNSEEIQGNYYEAYKTTLSSAKFGNGATGITFYYNGIVYAGFAK